MWDSDRLHMSKAGHKYLAAQVLDHLGVPHKIKPKEWDPPVEAEPAGVGAAGSAAGCTTGCCRLFGRKIRGVTLGDQLRPRWPEPVKVPRKAGLKKLLQAQHAGGETGIG